MQEKIYLRPLCLNDVSEKYLSWVNDSYVTEYLEIGKESACLIMIWLDMLKIHQKKVVITMQ